VQPLYPITSPSAPPTPFEFQLKPTRQPMLWAALAYSSGIIAGVYAWRPASWWVFSASAFLAAGIYFVRRRKWIGVSLALGSLFVAGAIHIQLRGPANTLDTTLLPFADGQQVKMTAHVTREGRFREGSPGELRQGVDIETEELAFDNGTRIPVHSGVRLSVYGARPEKSALIPGSCRATSVILGISTISLTSPPTASPRWAPRKPRMSTCYPALWELVSNAGASAFTPALLPKCMRCGRRSKPR